MKEILNRMDVSLQRQDLIEDGLLYSGSTSAVWKYVYQLTMGPTAFLVPVIIDAHLHEDDKDLEALRVLRSLLTTFAAKVDEVLQLSVRPEGS